MVHGLLNLLALGFEISTVFPPTLEAGDRNILIWVQVNAANRGDKVFCNDGVYVVVEVTITTSDQRTYQKTWLIRVKQI